VLVGDCGAGRRDQGLGRDLEAAEYRLHGRYLV
jgi:hypothetical protein